MHGKTLKRGLEMTESEKMLKRQAEWQRSRSTISWKQKLEASVVMRKSLKGFDYQTRDQNVKITSR